MEQQEQGIPVERLFALLGQKELELNILREQIQRLQAQLEKQAEDNKKEKE